MGSPCNYFLTKCSLFIELKFHSLLPFSIKIYPYQKYKVMFMSVRFYTNNELYVFPVLISDFRTAAES